MVEVRRCCRPCSQSLPYNYDTEASSGRYQRSEKIKYGRKLSAILNILRLRSRYVGF